MASKFASGLFPRPAAVARRLTKGRLKADPHIDELIRFDGGYGQQRRTRKWAAFAFANKPSEQTLQDEF